VKFRQSDRIKHYDIKFNPDTPVGYQPVFPKLTTLAFCSMIHFDKLIELLPKRYSNTTIDKPNSSDVRLRHKR